MRRGITDSGATWCHLELRRNLNALPEVPAKSWKWTAKVFSGALERFGKYIYKFEKPQKSLVISSFLQKEMGLTLHKIIKMMKVIKKDAFVSKWTRGVLFYGQEKL